MRNWMRRIVAVGTGMVVAAGLLVSPLATLGLCVLVTVCVVAVVLCSANEDVVAREEEEDGEAGEDGEDGASEA
jgi:hypothetical protein